MSKKSDRGGVFIGTATYLQATLVPEFQSEAEDVWIYFKVTEVVGVYFCCVYLPPGEDDARNSFVSKLNWIAERLGKDNKVIICGDFNCSALN